MPFTKSKQVMSKKLTKSFCCKLKGFYFYQFEYQVHFPHMLKTVLVYICLSKVMFLFTNKKGVDDCKCTPLCATLHKVITPLLERESSFE